MAALFSVTNALAQHVPATTRLKEGILPGGRNMISGRFATMYDNLGWIGFMLAFLVGGWVTWKIVAPILGIFEALLLHA